MTVAIVASLGAMLLGGVLAHVAGYFGGLVDWLIGRIVDVWMSFPPVILSLILMVGLGTGLRNVILAIVLVDWTRFCRVLRSEVLVVRAARLRHGRAAVGFSHWRTITREIVPATVPLLITLISLEMGIAVIVEAILSFVGMSVSAQTPAWGQMIADARLSIYQSSWNLMFPILAIFVTVFGFNISGRRPAPHARCASRRDGSAHEPACRARSCGVGDARRRTRARAARFQLRAGAGTSSRPGRRVRRRQVDGRPHHRADAAAGLCGDRRQPCVRRRRSRRDAGAGAPRAARARTSPSFRRSRCPRSIRCSPSASRSTSIWRRLGARLGRASGGRARSRCSKSVHLPHGEELLRAIRTRFPAACASAC